MTDPNALPTTRADVAPAFQKSIRTPDHAELRRQLGEAFHAWLTRSPSAETRDGYSRDLFQFLDFAEVPSEEWEKLSAIRPATVAAYRDRLLASRHSNTGVARKLSAVRSLFSYLRAYGYTGGTRPTPRSSPLRRCRGTGRPWPSHPTTAGGCSTTRRRKRHKASATGPSLRCWRSPGARSAR